MIEFSLGFSVITPSLGSSVVGSSLMSLMIGFSLGPSMTGSSSWPSVIGWFFGPSFLLLCYFFILKTCKSFFLSKTDVLFHILFSKRCSHFTTTLTCFNNFNKTNSEKTWRNTSMIGTREF